MCLCLREANCFFSIHPKHVLSITLGFVSSTFKIYCIHYCCCLVSKSVWLFVTPWTAACQASLSFTISLIFSNSLSWFIELVLLSNHLILCQPLLLLSSIFPSIRVFSNESALRIRWPKYWSFSIMISPSKNIQGWFPLGLTDLISLLSKGLLSI